MDDKPENNCNKKEDEINDSNNINSQSNGLIGEKNKEQQQQQQTQNVVENIPTSPSYKVILPWDRFSYWVNSIVIVTFDIELGQSLETIYPTHVKLTDKDKLNICYLSFPDSNSGFLGDTKFHFRIKLESSNLTSSSATNFDEYNRKIPVGLQVDKSYLFGYVFFRQVKEKSLKRGYFQKSVVILSKFPFIKLFYYILDLIAPEYFNNGNDVLETVCHDIDQWPYPTPGEFLSLPLLGQVIEIVLPVKSDKSPTQNVNKKDIHKVPVSLPNVYEINIYKCLLPIINHIHLLWELVVLAEPIVVMASVPNICSEIVQALVSTTWPLKYASDYRPFFTIHNTEFQEYASKHHQPPSIIVGVTNPFFTKSLQHWPHIIKINDMKSDIEDKSKAAKIKKTNNIKIVDSKPAVYTRYQTFLNIDKTIIKTLNKGELTNRPTEAQSAILRRHFMELTQNFIIPLERYFTSLLPFQKNISPFKSVPKLKPFDAEEFTKYLDDVGPQKTFGIKGDWSGFYKRFFDSLNFKYWFEEKQREVEKKLEALHIESLCDYDVTKWLQGKHEIEIIDQYIRIKQKLDSAEKNDIQINEESKKKIKNILKQFAQALPEDMQSILKK